MFSPHLPVTEADFWDRREPLARLAAAVDGLEQGRPEWIALLGPRKIGKTSLLRELERQRGSRRVLFAVVDAFEAAPVSPLIFRALVLRLLDRALATELGSALESLASSPAELRGALERSDRVAALPAAVRSVVYGLADRPMDSGFLRACLELPEQLCAAWGLHAVVAIDEFQELAALRGAGIGELMPLLRATWQRHKRVAYVISGSERTMLLQLVTSRGSPFFGHFSIMELGAFSREDAVGLLTERALKRPIPRPLAEKAVDVLGGHPYYLQLLGHSLLETDGALDARALKQALGGLIFTNTGRLALHFSAEHQRLVGRSTALAAVLDALAARPRRLSELATAIGASSPAAKTYLGRLGDVVLRDGALYRLADPVFGLWLAWRGPGGAAVPMKVIGDEAEARVAEALARMGFDLVYQSRASRGAFDLLAIRGGAQLGVQVKRTRLPATLPASAWRRMEAEGKRLGWRWVVATVGPPPEEPLHFLDPARVNARADARLREDAAIENLLAWLDERRERTRRG